MHKHVKQLKPYFEAAQLMVVSSTNDNKPYVATVFYCVDKDLHIYFHSKTTRRHSKEIIANPYVALAIASHRVEWGAIMKGLQVEGTCIPLQGQEALKAFKLYTKKFPKSKSIEQEFTSDATTSIHRMWKVTPTRIKIWDESKYAYEGFLLEL